MSEVMERQKVGRFLSTRIIQSYLKNSKYFGKDWQNVCQKLPIDNLKNFVILVKEFHDALPARMEKIWFPMHVAAECGDLDFCQIIVKATATKSPLSQDKWMPIHFATQAGHSEVVKFLSEDIEYKNPRTDNGLSLLHLAAKNGHMEIFQSISERVIEKNPSMDNDVTPLHLAAQNGNFDICKYICDNVTDIRPERSDGSSPLLLAIHRCQLKIAKLLIESDADNIRADVLYCWRLLRRYMCIVGKAALLSSICILMLSTYGLFGISDEMLQKLVSFLYLSEVSYIPKWYEIIASSVCLFVFLAILHLVCTLVFGSMGMILIQLLMDIWFSYWKSPIMDH